MKEKPKLKLFQVRKFIMAKDAIHAIKLDKTHKVDDVWIDDEWKKGQHNTLASAIGFTTNED